jgi:hypothetical protein
MPIATPALDDPARASEVHAQTPARARAKRYGANLRLTRARAAFGERERLLDAQPARQSTMIIARSHHPWRSSAVWRMTATISSIVGGSAG